MLSFWVLLCCLLAFSESRSIGTKQKFGPDRIHDILKMIQDNVGCADIHERCSHLASIGECENAVENLDVPRHAEPGSHTKLKIHFLEHLRLRK